MSQRSRIYYTESQKALMWGAGKMSKDRLADRVK
jgi:hypothetical protein